MSLCNLCQSFDILDLPNLSLNYTVYPVTSKAYPSLVSNIHKLRIGGWKKDREDPKHDSEPLGLPYHQSIEALEAACTNNCAICTVVQRDVAQFKTEFLEAKKDTSAYRERSGGPDWRMFAVRGVGETGGFMIVSADTKAPFEIWVVAAVGVCVDYKDPLTSIIRGRKILSDSQHTLQHALSWVRDCDKQRTDSRCHVDAAPLPARVLDIRSSASHKVSLYEPAEGELGRYAALSYVWGESSPFITTKANIEANKEGVDIDRLPETFQDAIFVAREMGIGYLWIDSLCICQDDSSDWSRETSRMSSVYSNAYIMLSATGSASSNAGLSIFSPTRPAPTYSSFPYTSTEGTKGTLLVFSYSKEVTRFPAWSGPYELLKNEPLTQRGWALQERWLAPRILHFGSKEMFFECYCGFKGENGFSMEGRKDTLFPTTSPDSSPAIPNDTSSDEIDFTEPEPMERQWNSVLSNYNKRQLTNASDKLPALSGLARTYQDITGDTYLAGHWRSTLLQSLIWQATGYPTVPDTYRAPSWSWAAIDGSFGMFSPGMGFDKGDWVSLATIHDAWTNLKNEENPFGEVTDGQLDISAPLERFFPFASKDEEGVEWPKNYKVAKVRTQNASGDSRGYNHLIFDSADHAERAKGRVLWVAVLLKHVRAEENKGVWESSVSYHGIVVAEVKGRQNVYERLGKIPFGEKDLGECGWMSNGDLVERFALV
ncbi:unnamed protein product [Alternaria burnsii]|nr:unnamed protein product [Alternaria burnsii]